MWNLLETFASKMLLDCFVSNFLRENMDGICGFAGFGVSLF